MQQRQLTATERIRRLERQQTWIWRLGWLWLAVAFWLFMTQVELDSGWVSALAIVTTLGPLCAGALYSFFVIAERIHRLEMSRLLPTLG